MDITPQVLTKFTDEEARKLEQAGFKNSNEGAYPCMRYINGKSFDLCIYKLHSNEFVYDMWDNIMREKKQVIYPNLQKLLSFLKRYYR